MLSNDFKCIHHSNQTQIRLGLIPKNQKILKHSVNVRKQNQTVKSGNSDPMDENVSSYVSIQQSIHSNKRPESHHKIKSHSETNRINTYEVFDRKTNFMYCVKPESKPISKNLIAIQKTNQNPICNSPKIIESLQTSESISHNSINEYQTYLEKELQKSQNVESCYHSCFSKSLLKSNTEITSNTLPLDYSVKVKRIGHRLEYVLEFTEDDVKACKSLLKSIKQNVCFQLKTDAEHLLLDRVWRPISHSLLQYDIKWDPNKCEQSFKQLVKLYKQVLKKAPNRYIASEVYPLFDFIHSFDLKRFLNDYQKISKYINQFELKFNNFSNPSSSAVECDWIAINNRPKLLSKFFSNTESSSQTTTDCWDPICYFDSNVFTKSRAPSNQFLDFKTKIDSFENQMIYVLEFSAQEVNAYQSLLKSISKNLPNVKTIPHFLKSEQKIDHLSGFWEKVSQLMKSKCFNNWSQQKCFQRFNESLDIYKNVLIKAPNRLMASKVYPLFDIIQAFDLKLYPEFQDLEKEFEKKCGQC